MVDTGHGHLGHGHLGHGYGGGNSGNAPKKTFFLTGGLPLPRETFSSGWITLWKKDQNYANANTDFWSFSQLFYLLKVTAAPYQDNCQLTKFLLPTVILGNGTLSVVTVTPIFYSKAHLLLVPSKQFLWLSFQHSPAARASSSPQISHHPPFAGQSNVPTQKGAWTIWKLGSFKWRIRESFLFLYKGRRKKTSILRSGWP